MVPQGRVPLEVRCWWILRRLIGARVDGRFPRMPLLGRRATRWRSELLKFPASSPCAPDRSREYVWL